MDLFATDSGSQHSRLRCERTTFSYPPPGECLADAALRTRHFRTSTERLSPDARLWEEEKFELRGGVLWHCREIP